MDAIGEILSASITSCIAECWQDNRAKTAINKLPGFGSIIKINCSELDLRVFAVVFDVLTGPRDSLHKPAALRLSRSQLRAEQPQIFALLKTELQSSIIGYESAGNYQVGLPPHPPEVHDFIYCADAEQITKLTEDLDFLRLIIRSNNALADELITATLKESYVAHGRDYGFLVRAGQFLAHNFRDDYDRLSAILRKLSPNTSADAN